MATQKIRLNYLIAGSLLFALGYCLLWIERWYLPAASEKYQWFSAIHGTIMVFFGIVPVAFLWLGYYVIPSARGSKMFFPQLDTIALCLFYMSVIGIIIAIFIPATRVLSVAMSLNLASAMICCLNFIATVVLPSDLPVKFISLRSVMWALVVLSSILFVNFLMLEIAAFMQVTGHLNGSASARISPPLLPIFWKHLFWFMGHPEVIILLMVSLGLSMDGLGFIYRRLLAK
jgi:cytochrome c oxidase subunit I